MPDFDPGRADSDASSAGFSVYSAGATQVYNHSVAEFTSFFGSLELLPPGVTDARAWRPDWEQPVQLPHRAGQVIVGVARVGWVSRERPSPAGQEVLRACPQARHRHDRACSLSDVPGAAG